MNTISAKKDNFKNPFAKKPLENTILLSPKNKNERKFSELFNQKEKDYPNEINPEKNLDRISQKLCLSPCIFKKKSVDLNNHINQNSNEINFEKNLKFKELLPSQNDKKNNQTNDKKNNQINDKKNNQINDKKNNFFNSNGKIKKNQLNFFIANSNPYKDKVMMLLNNKKSILTNDSISSTNLFENLNNPRKNSNGFLFNKKKNLKKDNNNFDKITSSNNSTEDNFSLENY